ncbi:uncharacterized protein V6R79_019382 [Siganus canaliculatus]
MSQSAALMNFTIVDWSSYDCVELELREVRGSEACSAPNSVTATTDYPSGRERVEGPSWWISTCLCYVLRTCLHTELALRPLRASINLTPAACYPELRATCLSYYLLPALNTCYLLYHSTTAWIHVPDHIVTVEPTDNPPIDLVDSRERELEHSVETAAAVDQPDATAVEPEVRSYDCVELELREVRGSEACSAPNSVTATTDYPSGRERVEGPSWWISTCLCYVLRTCLHTELALRPLRASINLTPAACYPELRATCLSYYLLPALNTCYLLYHSTTAWIRE